MINPINSFMIDDVKVKTKTTITLLRLATDSKLYFMTKANFKSNTLKQIRSYRYCIYSNFVYCLIIWMFISKAINTKTKQNSNF